MALFWSIFGLINIYFSIEIISADLNVLPLLSTPGLNPWFGFGVPADLILAIFVLCLGLVQLVTVPGLLTRKFFSFKLSLIIPILLIMATVFSAVLYAFAPAEIYLSINLVKTSFSFVMSAIWVGILWYFMAKPAVKAFLKITESSSILKEDEKFKVEPSIEDESAFYCRYCGTGNKSDSLFCEKCGKKIIEN
jgi:hypothetical protein